MNKNNNDIIHHSDVMETINSVLIEETLANAHYDNKERRKGDRPKDKTFLEKLIVIILYADVRFSLLLASFGLIAWLGFCTASLFNAHSRELAIANVFVNISSIVSYSLCALILVYISVNKLPKTLTMITGLMLIGTFSYTLSTEHVATAIFHMNNSSSSIFVILGATIIQRSRK